MKLLIGKCDLIENTPDCGAKSLTSTTKGGKNRIRKACKLGKTSSTKQPGHIIRPSALCTGIQMKNIFLNFSIVQRPFWWMTLRIFGANANLHIINKS